MSTTTTDRVRTLTRQLLEECPPATTPQEEFLGRRFDLGLAWVHFPEGRGGLDLEPALQQVIDEELAGTGAPEPMWLNPIGFGMAAPTLLAYARPDQLDRLLRPLFTTEEVWCQLFSEPGAGSDVAGLSTRAVKDSDHWVVNGQKVWTSVGHHAKWGLLVARTDPEAVKHRGLTYFVVDMKSPGVDVRPLIQITGDAEFNEVYFTDVVIPDENRLGDVGAGWSVAVTTLMNERVAIGGLVEPRNGGVIGEALAVWREEKCDDDVDRDRLLRFWIRAEALRLTNIRSSQTRKQGTPGPDGSIGKIVSSELNKECWAFVMDLMGMDGTLFPAGYHMGSRSQVALMTRDRQTQFLRAPANSIEGGTTEVMRNILGERVLGLPGDVRVDKDLPWSKVPRN